MTADRTRLGRRALGKLTLARLGAQLGCASNPDPPREAIASVELPAAPQSHSSNGASGRSTQPDLKVGVYLPLTGENAFFGVEAKLGVELATRRFNERGGARGRRVQLAWLDDRSDMAELHERLGRFVEESAPMALIGEISSMFSKVGAIVAQRVRVPMITPGSTHADVTKVGDYVFRACLTDALMASGAAEYASTIAHARKVGVLSASDDPYSIDAVSAFKAEAKRRNLPIVHQATALSRDTSFATQLAGLKAASVDLVFAPIYYTQAVPLVQQARASGLAASAFLGTDAWIGDESALTELEGAMAIDHFAADAPWKSARELAADCRADHGGAPTALTAAGFDAARILFDALSRVEELSPSALRSAIAATKDLHGATGILSMGPERDPEKPCTIVELRGGRARFKALVGANAKATLANSSDAK